MFVFDQFGLKIRLIFELIFEYSAIIAQFEHVTDTIGSEATSSLLLLTALPRVVKFVLVLILMVTHPIIPFFVIFVMLRIFGV